MASWISIYCTRSLAELTAKQLLKGITGKDAKARAGVDYLTLAEDYDVDEDAAEAAEDALAIERSDDGFIVTYGTKRPVFVRRWAKTVRVASELEEAREHEGSKAVEQRLGKTTEVIGIELGASQLTDFGIVVAYELARYLAQKGRGIICDLDHHWSEVVDGGFAEL